MGAGLKKQFRADLYSKDSHAEKEWKVDQSKIIIIIIKKSINNVRSLQIIRLSMFVALTQSMILTQLNAKCFIFFLNYLLNCKIKWKLQFGG